MTSQYDVSRSNDSSQKDSDNWILQRSAVRELPAKTLTSQRETVAGYPSGINLDLLEIPVSNHSANSTQLQAVAQSDRDIPVQRQEEERKAENKTGLPDGLKTGIESMSGFDLSGVRVNYNSPKPAQLNAHAYTQGNAIEVAPGQEKHLPHEAWHVVQQMQGRVRPTMQMKGVQINDDDGLEREADVMSKKAEYRENELTHVVQRNDGAEMKTPQMQEQLKQHQDKETPTKIIKTQNTQLIQLSTNPVGSFAKYDAAKLEIVDKNAGDNPTKAKVLNCGTKGPNSQPKDPGGWKALTQKNEEDMTGTSHPPTRTQYKLDLNLDRDQGHKYTRMHAVNSFLAKDSNVSGNIFSGRQSYNKKHLDRAEGFAKNFMDDQSWQKITGKTLANTLNGTDKIGKNVANQLYYQPSKADKFPPAFVNDSVKIVGNDGNKYDGINDDEFKTAPVMEYEVKPVYKLDIATVKTNIQSKAESEYKKLKIEDNMDGSTSNEETIDPNGILNTAAQALVNTYATRMQVDLIHWEFNPDAITAGNDSKTKDVSWREYSGIPIIITPDPSAPGAKVQFKYIEATKAKAGKPPAKKAKKELKYSDEYEFDII
ncbi:MAG: DUF4157 domain-containing protein [Symploca sp. SIO1B1]|nr:DUF4157 domain-containing protein [Symploca sp. SIO1B1]